MADTTKATATAPAKTDTAKAPTPGQRAQRAARVLAECYNALGTRPTETIGKLALAGGRDYMLAVIDAVLALQDLRDGEGGERLTITTPKQDTFTIDAVLDTIRNTNAETRKKIRRMVD